MKKFQIIERDTGQLWAIIKSESPESALRGYIEKFPYALYWDRKIPYLFSPALPALVAVPWKEGMNKVKVTFDLDGNYPFTDSPYSTLRIITADQLSYMWDVREVQKVLHERMAGEYDGYSFSGNELFVYGTKSTLICGVGHYPFTLGIKAIRSRYK